jgi:type II secretory pathway pseudopilin PulG
MRGFTLVEALVALSLLSFALLSLAMLFPLGTRLAAVSGVSNETAMLVGRELSQISTHVFDSSGSFVDLAGNTMDVGCPGSPGTSCGNPLTSSGLIDFTQAPPVGFSAQLTVGGVRQYSIRWNISVTANNGRKIVVAGEALNPTGGLAPVVQYQTLKAP